MVAQSTLFTVKQLADLACVSVRTLHYYDQIGLLRPTTVGENGYRYYDTAAALRLQQILFYRELDLPLDEIKRIINRPDFDLLQALKSHRRSLLARQERLNRLIDTVDQTIAHLRGEIDMTPQDFYAGFDEEQQKEYAREAEERWGEKAAQSQKRWEALTRDQKNEILAGMNEIQTAINASFDQGPESEAAQTAVDRWYRFINQHFYDCSLEGFEGLGHMYVEDPRFRANYEKMRPGLAEFMEKAVVHYVRSKRG